MKKKLKKVVSQKPVTVAKKKKAVLPVKKTKTSVAKAKVIPTKKKVVKKTAPTRMTKTQMLQEVADRADLPLRDVKVALNAFEEVILDSVSRKGSGEFMMTGLFKITATDVPAKKARRGINPFTGEETTFKAKPASVKLKIRPLTKLKKAAL